MAETEEQESKPKSLLSVFPKIQLNFPFLNKESKGEASVKGAKMDTAVTTDDGDAEKSAVARVSFPYTPPKFLEPLESEVEADVSSGRTSNPVVLWQVYALGGFLILRWVWARWKERKERGKKKDTPGDDHLPPADEDYQTASAGADDDFQECR